MSDDQEDNTKISDVPTTEGSPNKSTADTTSAASTAEVADDSAAGDQQSAATQEVEKGEVNPSFQAEDDNDAPKS